MRPSAFISTLAELKFKNTFNPYADECPEHDAEHAPRIRCANLAMVLEAALAGGTDSVWVGRDLGYRGGRRTGLALTDEVHLSSHGHLYGALPLARATRGPEVAERTAQVIWHVLNAVKRPVFLWNVFPLHPHAPDSPLSNRGHTRAERDVALPLLDYLLKALRPRTVFAIGRDAQHALDTIGIVAVPVRHPSYGGQRDFLNDMCRHYRVTLGSPGKRRPTG